MRFLFISAMRNEAPYLLEWIAYHKVIGVDHFLIYSNDCSDGTDAMLDRLAEMGVVTHERNDKIGKKGVQWTALERADEHPLKAQAEWCMFTDVDEFTHVKAGGGHLGDLLSAAPDATAFALIWRQFGNSGVQDILDTPVIEQFTHCAPFPCLMPFSASNIKTLFKNNGAYQKLGVHRPLKLSESKKGTVRWVNGSGVPLGSGFLENIGMTWANAGGIDLACVNHYSVKSNAAFLVKSDRGLPNRTNKPVDVSYWAERNFNVEQNIGILDHKEKMNEVRDEWLADPLLGGLHARAVQWHKARAQMLLSTQAGFRLYMLTLGVSRVDTDPKTAMRLMKIRQSIRHKTLNENKPGQRK